MERHAIVRAAVLAALAEVLEDFDPIAEFALAAAPDLTPPITNDEVAQMLAEFVRTGLAGSAGASPEFQWLDLEDHWRIQRWKERLFHLTDAGWEAARTLAPGADQP